MSGGIFVIQDNGEFYELTEEPYASEDLLQGYLARYPSLLAGDQFDSVNPRRWPGRLTLAGTWPDNLHKFARIHVSSVSGG